MYTGSSVHSGAAREEPSPTRIEEPDLNETLRGASVVEKPKAERVRARNSWGWGRSHCPLLEVAGTRRTHGEVQEGPGNQRDPRAGLEEAARSEEGRAS